MSAESGVAIETFLSARDVVRRLGVGQSTRYRMIKWREFPRPMRLGPRRVAWIEDEIETWIQRRIEERDAAA